jgi:hypothetical protein
MPGAAYMVASMSSISCPRAASNSTTGSALVRNLGSGYSRIGRRVIAYLLGGSK